MKLRQWTISLVAVLSVTMPLQALAISNSPSPAGPQVPHISINGHMGAVKFPSIPNPPTPPVVTPPPTTGGGNIPGGGIPGGGNNVPPTTGGGNIPGGGGNVPPSTGGGGTPPILGNNGGGGNTPGTAATGRTGADVGFLHPNNSMLRDARGNMIGTIDGDVIQVAGGIVNAEAEDPRSVRAILLVRPGQPALNLTETKEVSELKHDEELSTPVSYNLTRPSVRPLVNDLYYTAAEKYHSAEIKDLSVIYLNFVTPVNQ